MNEVPIQIVDKYCSRRVAFVGLSAVYGVRTVTSAESMDPCYSIRAKNVTSITSCHGFLPSCQESLRC